MESLDTASGVSRVWRDSLVVASLVLCLHLFGAGQHRSFDLLGAIMRISEFQPADVPDDPEREFRKCDLCIDDCYKDQKCARKEDERGRFCSFNTICGRNCTPTERDRCMWWKHAKDELVQKPLDLMPPLSHAKGRSDGK